MAMFLILPSPKALLDRLISKILKPFLVALIGWVSGGKSTSIKRVRQTQLVNQSASSSMPLTLTGFVNDSSATTCF
jgi:hypothetical protein